MKIVDERSIKSMKRYVDLFPGETFLCNGNLYLVTTKWNEPKDRYISVCLEDGTTVIFDGEYKFAVVVVEAVIKE